jgi:hypothetical protein
MYSGDGGYTPSTQRRVVRDIELDTVGASEHNNRNYYVRDDLWHPRYIPESTAPEKKTVTDIIAGKLFDSEPATQVKHGWFQATVIAYLILMTGCFVSVMAVTLSSARHHLWWRIQWTVDGYQEFSKRYEIVTIVLPLGLGTSMVTYALYHIPYLWKVNRYWFYRDGYDHFLLMDTIVGGIPIIWLTASLCGITDLAALLLTVFVYVAGHAFLATAEFYGYNRAISSGNTGSPVPTFLWAFVTHALLIILLPLHFNNGSRHHSTAAVMVLVFTLLHMFIYHLASALITFYHTGDAKDGYIRFGQMYAVAVRGGAQSTPAKVKNWVNMIGSIDSWNVVRLTASMFCRLAIVIAILSGDVFKQRGEVVF